MQDISLGRDGAAVQANLPGWETLRYKTMWVCEKWSEDAVDFARRKLDTVGEIGSDALRNLLIKPELVEVREGNLLLNEGIQRLLDLLIAAGGTAYNNANSYIGVGDTNTAAAASQTELQAAANAANRFYKGMVVSYPARTSQTVDWRSDFTSTEANFAWQEWTVASGASSSSGSGFLVGTTNLNRKVESLGTKSSGTWTMTASITIS